MVKAKCKRWTVKASMDLVPTLSTFHRSTASLLSYVLTEPKRCERLLQIRNPARGGFFWRFQVRTSVGIAVVYCMISGAVWAQSTAQIHGTVQDSTGGAVAGVEVKAIHTETGLSRSVASEADGGFVLTNLPLGP